MDKRQSGRMSVFYGMSQYYFPCVASENIGFQIIHVMILNLNFLQIVHFSSIDFTIIIASFEDKKIKDSAS